MTITEMYGVLDGLIKGGLGPCEILDPDGCDITNVEIRTFPAGDGMEEETVVFLR